MLSLLANEQVMQRPSVDQPLELMHAAASRGDLDKSKPKL